MKTAPIALAALLVAGCTTYKVWNEFDSDSAAGTLQLSYEYRNFENPQVDERAGVEYARERCGDWGRKGTPHRVAEDRVCITGTERDCSKWRLIRTYQCEK